MELTTTTIAILAGLGVLSLAVGWLLASLLSKNSIRAAKSQVDDIMADAERKAERAKQKVILQAKEEWFKKLGRYFRERLNRRVRALTQGTSARQTIPQSLPIRPSPLAGPRPRVKDRSISTSRVARKAVRRWRSSI